MSDLEFNVVDGKCLFTSEETQQVWEDRELGFAIYQVIDVLYKRSVTGESEIEWSTGYKLFEQYIPEPYFYFVLHTLECFGLEEHGSSTPGWLDYSDEAEVTYKALKEIFGPLEHKLESADGK